MAVQVMSFYDKNSNPGSIESIYTGIYCKLQVQYGQPINHDDNGAVFRGKNGETAVLMDRSITTDIHELVLIDVPRDIRNGLEEFLESVR